ncbi:MAG: DUF234 domain-containing protein, partial [Deltaproteobacteria bacterium]|nr:DUF234 domain-containing protein [Deltaproteobacteria bacterium]
FFTFWFKYVFPNRSRLEIGDTAYVTALLKDDLERHVSLAFEDACRDICGRLMRDGVMSYTRIGRWWSKDAEIDLVAFDEDEGTAWFGECKWSRKKVGEDIYRDLVRKSALVDWKTGTREDRFILFGRSGFTDGMERIAKEENCVLVDGGRVVPNRARP